MAMLWILWLIDLFRFVNALGAVSEELWESIFRWIYPLSDVETWVLDTCESHWWNLPACLEVFFVLAMFVFWASVTNSKTFRTTAVRVSHHLFCLNALPSPQTRPSLVKVKDGSTFWRTMVVGFRLSSRQERWLAMASRQHDSRPPWFAARLPLKEWWSRWKMCWWLCAP